ncbi:MAG TPA: hypothetical protein VK633_03280, partial [Verrucomicrobiae bacterium]|nr:hypothetical protein [Verrucomicrobiae bacterium]
VLSVAAPRSGQAEFQSALRFDVGPAVAAFNSQFGPGRWSIQSVSLQMTVTSGGHPIFNNPNTGTFGVAWMQNDSWVEGSGTPDAPGASGITFGSLQNTFQSAADENLGSFRYDLETTGRRSYPLGLPLSLAADIASGGSVSVRLFGDTGNTSTVFNSRSFGSIGDRPVLTIEAVPEPGAIRLLALGVVISGWRFAWTRKR